MYTSIATLLLLHLVYSRHVPLSNSTLCVGCWVSCDTPQQLRYSANDTSSNHSSPKTAIDSTDCEEDAVVYYVISIALFVLASFLGVRYLPIKNKPPTHERQ